MALGCEVARSQIPEPPRASLIRLPSPNSPPALAPPASSTATTSTRSPSKGVRTIVNNRPDGEDPGQLPAAEARQAAEAHGIAYHHIPVTAATLIARRGGRVRRGAGERRRSRSSCIAAAAPARPCLWALVRLREGADPFALIGEAARHGIDIAALPAIAARLR